jgi:transposase
MAQAKLRRRGRKPTLNRAERARVRLMRGAGQSIKRIALRLEVSTKVVYGAVWNTYARPDDIAAGKRPSSVEDV